MDLVISLKDVCLRFSSSRDWSLRDMAFQNAENQIVGMTVHEDTAFGLFHIGVAPEPISKAMT
ncbi:hypothetical protein [Cohnella sp. REN36]|uniref:hypothetical protein n=1 Tax=Cohnella sp. REN36 TaxID=2887347 RepID=UPI001D150483|nr:hypothetical protein [Cohnella sp. REN36]MCC3373645.1 hypothetical protein [Cohnella sp. REN36]